MVTTLLAMFALSTPALAAPLITLSSNYGAIGTKVTIDGTNFDSYRGDNIFLYFDNEEIAKSPLKVPETGTFSIEFYIPSDATPGRHVVKVRSEIGSTLTSSLFVIPETEIRLDTIVGTVGTTVTIEGDGFYASRMVTIYYYNRIRETLGTQTASDIGDFSYSFTIPSGTAGTHRILAYNAEGNSAEAEFKVLPSTNLNLSSGAAGDILTISGTGFGFRSDVSIYFGSDEAAYAKTDEYGNFEVTFNVPEMKPGTYDVKAEDEKDNVDWEKFTITAGASLSQASGAVGTELIVKGIGFKPEETVIIKYETLQVATTTTDANGAFATAFYVPESTRGAHTVTVSDGTTTKMLPFTVESIVPPIPTPLLPLHDSETRAKAYFDWEDVTDPSLPVTYRLQIASDQNLTSIVLDKKGLTTSEYALTEDEKLPAAKKESLYYWRVKAIDSADNESDWSIPWSCYVATLPAPAPLSPETGSKTEALVLFDWQDVSALSPPITYHFQIATDENFTSILMEKKGLSNSEYTLAEDENLPAVRKEAPYHWRVKAIDGSGNESDWSTPWSCYVGFSFALPGWLLYTLIGLGILVIGFFAFWAGRRTAYYQEEI
ncbi:hypothetical protein ES703_79590 [subsurface metagenome]